MDQTRNDHEECTHTREAAAVHFPRADRRGGGAATALLAAALILALGACGSGGSGSSGKTPSSGGSGSWPGYAVATIRGMGSPDRSTGWIHFENLPGLSFKITSLKDWIGRYEVDFHNTYTKTISLSYVLKSFVPTETTDRRSIPAGQQYSTGFSLKAYYDTVYFRVERVRFGADSGPYYSSAPGKSALLLEGFDGGINDDVWAVEGFGIAIDVSAGDPAPSVVLDDRGLDEVQRMSTREPFVSGPGFIVEAEAGILSAAGSARIRVYEAETGIEIASVELSVDEDGVVRASYRLTSANALQVEETERVAWQDEEDVLLNLSFRVLEDGRGAWFLGDELRLASVEPMDLALVLVSLEARGARARFDSIMIDGGL